MENLELLLLTPKIFAKHAMNNCKGDLTCLFGNTGTDLRKYLQNASQKEELLNLILHN